MFTVIPVICFGYQCHVNAVPIYACLKNKTLKEFSKSITASLIIVFAAYTLTATFGYLTFGVEINDDLLRSYDAKDASVLVAVIMYLIKTYTSYPLNLFCARTAIEGVWIEVFHLNTETILLNERSEKNTSEREREREKKKARLVTFIYLQMHMFFYTRPAAAVGQSSLQQHFILNVRMGNGVR